MSALAKKQLAQTRAEMERDLRKRAMQRLAALRSELKTARAQKRARLKQVGCECRHARKRISARAKAARARLNASIARTREQAKNLCTASKGQARHETLQKIESAMTALDTERATQRQLAAWTRPTTSTKQSKARAESRSESDDEVRNNLEEPGLLIVWDAVKHKIKGRGRTSRTEAFAEWVAEHPSEVYEIQEADAHRQILALEREERLLSKALKRTRYREPAGLAAVPF